jgi:hypothetical protein
MCCQFTTLLVKHSLTFNVFGALFICERGRALLLVRCSAATFHGGLGNVVASKKCVRCWLSGTFWQLCTTLFTMRPHDTNVPATVDSLSRWMQLCRRMLDELLLLFLGANVVRLHHVRGVPFSLYPYTSESKSNASDITSLDQAHSWFKKSFLCKDLLGYMCD